MRLLSPRSNEVLSFAVIAWINFNPAVLNYVIYRLPSNGNKKQLFDKSGARLDGTTDRSYFLFVFLLSHRLELDRPC